MAISVFTRQRHGDYAVAWGNSDELTRLLPGLNARNVPILSVTENADSAIAKASRLVISTGVQREADPLNMLATTSILLVLAIFDAACACLMSESGYSKETLLSVHPVVMWD